MEHIPQAQVDPFDHQPNCIRFLDISSSDRLAQVSAISQVDAVFLLHYDDETSSYRYKTNPVWSKWAQFIQAWGFFGLLRTACSICDLDFFSHTWSRDGFLSTKTLDRLCMEWELKRRGLTRVEIDHCLERLKESLSIISRHVGQAFPESARYRSFDALPIERDDGPIAVQLLLECLHGWTMRPHVGQDRRALDLALHISQSDLISSRLRAAGWLEEDVKSMERSTGMSYSHMLMVSSINRHSQVKKKPSPKNVLHAPDCAGTCSPIPLEEWLRILSAVRAHIKDKRIPVLRMGPSPESSLEVHAAANLPYIAISHVWTDGLNTEHDFLPRCQLRRVQHLADDLANQYKTLGLSTPVCFWLDPICVPKLPTPRRDPSVHDQVVEDAISMMGAIYQEAHAVIVLDAAVYRREFGGEIAEKPEILAAHIALSKWMTRGWTFQEAGLAERLYFRFKDMNANYLELRMGYARAKNFRTKSTFMPEVAPGGMLDPIHTLISMTDPCYRYSRNAIDGVWRWLAEDLPGQSNCEAVRRLYWRLFERSIGWMTDEAHIIRNLLPDPGPQLQVDVALQITPEQDDRLTDEQRKQAMQKQHRQLMRDLFSAFKELPLELLFHSGPHLESEYSRWMPESILRHYSSKHLDFGRLPTTRSMTPTKKGVLVTTPGLEFQLNPSSNGPWLLEVEGRLHRLELNFLDFDWNSLVDQQLILLLLPEAITEQRSIIVAINLRGVLTSRSAQADNVTAPHRLRYEAAVQVSHANKKPDTSTVLPGMLIQDVTWCVG